MKENIADKNPGSTELKIPTTRMELAVHRKERVARWLVGSGITVALTGAALAEFYPNNATPSWVLQPLASVLM